MKINKIKLKDIIPSEYNPRQMSAHELQKLSNNLEEFGLVDPIVIDLTDNNTIIGGHQRYNVLSDKYGENAEFNLLKLGDVGWVFNQSDLKIKDKNHQKALNIALNKISGEWDFNKLNEVMDQLQSNHFNMDLTGFEINNDLNFHLDAPFNDENISDDDNFVEFEGEETELNSDDKKEDSVDFSKYSQKIQTPVYEIKGATPDLKECYDDSKTKSLIEKINKSSLSDSQKQFLINTAYRLTVYKYDNIAEYYAHQDKEMQSLMEELALVIIDFDDAIKQGYIQIKDELMEEIKKYG